MSANVTASNALSAIVDVVSAATRGSESPATDTLHALANATRRVPGGAPVADVVEGAAIGAPLALAVIDLGMRAAEALESAARGAPLAPVRYAFRSDGDAHTPWRVVQVTLREGLTELYEGTVDLATDVLGADPDALLGAGCELTIARGASARRVHGVVRRVEHGGTAGGHLRCRVVVVPALWVLTQRTDSCVFQNVSVPEIIASVLRASRAPYRVESRFELQREYPRREYCVQYRETDLAFVRRLLEEEGISFYFDHAGEREVVVFVDANAALTPCLEHDAPVTIAGPEGATARRETVRSFERVREVVPGAVTVRDFDWTRPAMDLTRAARAANASGGDAEHERYEHETPATLGGYDPGRRSYTADDAQAQARLRREAIGMDAVRAEGTGNVTRLEVGRTFVLEGHGRDELNRRYVITRVEHQGVAADELTRDVSVDDSVGRYANRFECVPSDVPVRPRRTTPRPRVLGAQTAIVVGPPDEEIYTDEHGRIRVSFHWDRRGGREETASCWIRVAQAWAGAGFGALFIPRVGSEVVVDFLDGDPDRPLVVGSVYNGLNAPPVALPEHKTRSTIRTSSTPGGNGYNELRFEDAAGAEEVFLHAQRNLREVVGSDHATSVGCDQRVSVGRDRTETIGRDARMTVERSQFDVVEAHRNTRVAMNDETRVGGIQLVTVEGSQVTNVLGGAAVDGITGAATHVTGEYKVDATQRIRIESLAGIDLVCGETRITIDPTGIRLHAAGRAELVLDTCVNASGRDVALEATGEARMRGRTAIVYGSDGTTVAAPAVRLEGAHIAVEASVAARVVAASASRLALGGGATTLEGPSVTVTGSSVTIG